MSTEEKSLKNQRFHAEPASEREINEELAHLAKELGGDLSNSFTIGFFANRPTIEGQYADFDCSVIGQTTGVSGNNKGITISLIVKLPKRTSLSLKLQNVVSVRYSFYVDVDPTETTPQHNMPEELAHRIFPAELHYELLRSGLDFMLTVNPDRITLTTYGIYKHQLYLSLLDALTTMASALMEAHG